MARMIGDLTLGLRPIPAAVLAWLGTTPLESVWMAEEQADIRTTLWYRVGGGGLLLRVRRADDPATGPFLCLGISVSPSSGRTWVFEWEQAWSELPPSGGDMPPGSPGKEFGDDKVGEVVVHLLDRIKARLSRRPSPRPSRGAKGPGPHKAARPRGTRG